MYIYVYIYICIYIYVNARVCLLVLLYNLLTIHVCVFATAICIKTLFAQMGGN